MFRNSYRNTWVLLKILVQQVGVVLNTVLRKIIEAVLTQGTAWLGQSAARPESYIVFPFQSPVSELHSILRLYLLRHSCACTCEAGQPEVVLETWRQSSRRHWFPLVMLDSLLCVQLLTSLDLCLDLLTLCLDAELF